MEEIAERNNVRVVADENVRVLWLKSGRVEEFHVQAVPPPGLRDAREETLETYRSIVQALADAGPLRIVAEQAHLLLSEREVVLDARRKALKDSPLKAENPVSALDGRPCDRRGLAGVVMTLVRECDGVGVTPIRDERRLCGYRISDGKVVRAYLAAMDGIIPGCPEGTAAEQADVMFRRTNEALQGAGLSYHKVVCTRIRLRRMLEWYGEFNRVRNTYYRSMGIIRDDGASLVPASTGIQGKHSETAECVMEVAAMTRGEQGCPFTRLHSPLQNEATDYGSAFARAGSVDMPGVRYVFVSGTASIDTTGKSVFVGDPRGQVVKTIENVEAIVGAGGAKIADFCEAIWYCKDPSYAAIVREEMKRRKWPKLPCLMTCVDVCRADLLVEMEGLAVIPRV